MGSLDEEQRAGGRTSVISGTVLSLEVFFALYFTSLSGFSRLDLRADRLTIHYILPERTTILSFGDVTSVQEEPAHKGRRRLVLTTETSGTSERALVSRTDVRKVGEFLRQQMA